MFIKYANDCISLKISIVIVYIFIYSKHDNIIDTKPVNGLILWKKKMV